MSPPATLSSAERSLDFVLRFASHYARDDMCEEGLPADETSPRNAWSNSRMSTETDEQLMGRVIDLRDQHAFGALVDRHKAMGMTLAVRILTNHSLAEEALQDAFLRVWRSSHTFTFTASFKTWFYRILYNAALTKRKRELVHQEQTELTDDAAIVEESSTKAETTEVVLKSITRLPETQRTVLTLHYLQELSIEEIMEVTGMPNGTIKTHLFRGREKLRNDVTLKHYVSE
jgi:RNA polymerase sigma factor (sigma-70 family)